MKKFITYSITLFLLLLLVGCSTTNSSKTTDENSDVTIEDPVMTKYTQDTEEAYGLYTSFTNNEKNAIRITNIKVSFYNTDDELVAETEAKDSVQLFYAPEILEPGEMGYLVGNSFIGEEFNENLRVEAEIEYDADPEASSPLICGESSVIDVQNTNTGTQSKAVSVTVSNESTENYERPTVIVGLYDVGNALLGCAINETEVTALEAGKSAQEICSTIIGNNLGLDTVDHYDPRVNPGEASGGGE